MAIFFDGDANGYEVRVKRHPERTYFEEHVKMERRERLWDHERERYIIGESGAKFTIEALLFLPGRHDSVCHMKIYKPSDLDWGQRTTSDIIDELQYADVEIDRLKVLGARFAFRDLVVDFKLEDETDVMGIDPKNLGHFKIKLCRIKLHTRELTDEDLEEDIEKTELESGRAIQSRPKSEGSPSSVTDTSQLQTLWDTSKVDEKSFSDDGITQAVGFVGGLPEIIDELTSLTPLDVSPPIEETAQVGAEFYVTYYYRTKEFLEQFHIIKYPHPIHAFPWDWLNEKEKRAVLRKFQVINYDHFRQALNSKTGQMLPQLKIGQVLARFKTGEKSDDPKEWRPWEMMSEDEREAAFKTLKQHNAAYARGEDPNSPKAKSQEIISLIDDEEEERDSKAKIKKEIVVDLHEVPSANDKSTPAKAVVAYAEPTVKTEPKVKKKPVDQDSGQVTNGETQENGPISGTIADASGNAEIERKKAKLRRLGEEIEEEERIRTLKRQRRALEEEIEEAERKDGKK